MINVIRMISDDTLTMTPNHDVDPSSDEIPWTDATIRWTQEEGQSVEINQEQEDPTTAFLDIFADPDPTQEFFFSFPDKKIDLSIKGYKSHADQVWQSTGLTLWKASQFLCEYMVDHAEELQHQRILELGAGLGLNGILAHRLAPETSSVMITDGDTHALQLLRHNIQRNKSNNGKGNNHNNNISSKQLLWGQDTAQMFAAALQMSTSNKHHHPNNTTDGRFDIILASDIVYAEVVIDPLWETIQTLLSTKGQFWMAVAKRKVPLTIDFVLEKAQEYGFRYRKVAESSILENAEDDNNQQDNDECRNSVIEDAAGADQVFIYIFEWDERVPSLSSANQEMRGSGTSVTPTTVKGSTKVYHTADGAPYVICNTSTPFLNPTTPPDTTPETINETLNLTLGLPPSLLTYRSNLSPWILQFLELYDLLFLSWWTPMFFYIYAECIPATLKRCFIFQGWRYYFLLHRSFLFKTTGIHPSVSAEYHAITTLMYWAQFLVITPQRIRFSLGELYVISPTEIPSDDRVEWVSVPLRDSLAKQDIVIPIQQQQHCVVKGIYVHCKNGSKVNNSIVVVKDDNNSRAKKSRKIIFWIYGGAYLGGDCRGNITPADEFGNDCDMDGVFIPHIRLAPEATMDDVLWDICLTYQWVCQALVDDPSRQIVLVGLSSGAALGLRVMQMISERSHHEPKLPLLPSFLEPLMDYGCVRQPRCAVLFGPYVDYTEPKSGSFLHYAKHDLVVSEAVQEYGLPYLNEFIPKIGPVDTKANYNGRGRLEYSPVYRRMEGLPPLCFVVSEHEACYDMTIQTVNNARAAGVDVTVGVWKYMCHVFSFLHSFVPEGRLSIEFAKGWIRQQISDTLTPRHACSRVDAASRKRPITSLHLPLQVIGLCCLALIAWFLPKSTALSPLSFGVYNLDRFRAVCPADASAIEQFDPLLINDATSMANDDDSAWVAVYRSNNNKPSVMVRDEFFYAMNVATSEKTGDCSKMSSSTSSFLSETRSFLEVSNVSKGNPPVAIGRLRRSPDFKGRYLMDSLRCSLKKENMDHSCDGGSEFLEALGVAVDSLVLHHLERLQLYDSDENDHNDADSSDVIFEGTLRTKATLFTGKVLEQRGFEPVEELSKDMATHVSTYEACLNQYAERSLRPVNSLFDAKSSNGFGNQNDKAAASSNSVVTAGAQDRALQIVALLGQLDPKVQRQAASYYKDGTDEEKYDPWSNINLRR